MLIFRFDCVKLFLQKLSKEVNKVLSPSSSGQWWLITHRFCHHKLLFHVCNKFLRFTLSVTPANSWWQAWQPSLFYPFCCDHMITGFELWAGGFMFESRSCILPLMKHACGEGDWLLCWQYTLVKVSHQRWISWNIYHIHFHQVEIRQNPLWLWNPEETSPEVQNKGYQWPHKWLCDQQKFKINKVWATVVCEQGSTEIATENQAVCILLELFNLWFIYCFDFQIFSHDWEPNIENYNIEMPQLIYRTYSQKRDCLFLLIS